MNVYPFLPLIAFSANVILGVYILYRESKNKSNILFSLFAFSLAFWALTDFFTFAASSPESALYWNRMGTLGSSFTPAFLLHFLLLFSKYKLISKKRIYPLLYFPAFFFAFVGFTTDVISKSGKIVYWGHAVNEGILYFPFAFYMMTYIIIGLFFCYKYYLSVTSKNEKKQAMFFIIAIIIPIICGLITEIVPEIFGFILFPLSTTSTTITSIIVAYSIYKYNLMTPMLFSIQRKIIAGFLVVILISIISIFFITFQSRDALQKSFGENSTIFVNEAMDSIDRIIYYRFERWKSYAHSDLELFESLRKSNEEFENLTDIQGYINEKNQEWISVPYETITPFMQELIDNKLSDRLRSRTDFYEKKYGTDIFPEIFITNKYGANIAQTGKTSDYYQADEDWWQNIKRDGLYVEDVSYDESTGFYSIAIGILVDDEKGNFLGVMNIVYNIDDITSRINEMDLQDSNFSGHSRDDMGFKLLTKDGKIIFASEKFEFLENVTDELMSHFAEKNNSYFIGENLRNRDEEKLYAYAHSEGYKDYKGNGWILVIEHKTEELFTPISAFTNTIIIVIIIITIFSILFSVFISRSISKPIIQLSETACKIGEGNLDTKIEIESNDETGELASSFNKMAQDLKMQQENLEKTVLERTDELRQKIDELKNYKRLTIDRELKMIEMKKKLEEMSSKQNGGV